MDIWAELTRLTDEYRAYLEHEQAADLAAMRERRIAALGEAARAGLSMSALMVLAQACEVSIPEIFADIHTKTVNDLTDSNPF